MVFSLKQSFELDQIKCGGWWSKEVKRKLLLEIKANNWEFAKAIYIAGVDQLSDEDYAILSEIAKDITYENLADAAEFVLYCMPRTGYLTSNAEYFQPFVNFVAFMFDTYPTGHKWCRDLGQYSGSVEQKARLATASLQIKLYKSDEVYIGHMIDSFIDAGADLNAPWLLSAKYTETIADTPIAQIAKECARARGTSHKVDTLILPAMLHSLCANDFKKYPIEFFLNKVKGETLLAHIFKDSAIAANIKGELIASAMPQVKDFMLVVTESSVSTQTIDEDCTVLEQPMKVAGDILEEA